MAGTNWQQLSGGSTNPWTIRRDDGTPTANYGDHIICDGGTVILPAPQANEAVLVSNISATTEIVPNGTETIEGETSITYDQNNPIAFVSDGVDWYVSNNLNYFRAIPDSAVNHAVASDYDGSKWVADIGPDLSDAGGSPVQQTKTYRNQSIDVVEYTRADSDYSQNALAVDGSYCFIYVVASRVGSSTSVTNRYMDGGSSDSYTHYSDAGSQHKIATNGYNDTAIGGSSVDQNLNVFAFEVVGTGSGEWRLFKNGTSSPIISASVGSVNSLSNFTLNAKADASQFGDHDYAEYTVLEDHPQEDRDSEVNHLIDKYDI